MPAQPRKPLAENFALSTERLGPLPLVNHFIIGLDVALEALRDAWRVRRFKMAEVHRYARVCRVERVMTPYLEALVS
jgi:hypothetical protein